MAANQIVISQEAGKIASTEEVKIINEIEILSHEAKAVATHAEVQVIKEAEILSHEAETFYAPKKVQVINEVESRSESQAGTVATLEEMQIFNEAEISSHKSETVTAHVQIVNNAETGAELQARTLAAPELVQIFNNADILSQETKTVVTGKEVQGVIDVESPAEARPPTYWPAEARLTIYHPTNLPREGEVLFGQDGEVFYGSSTTIPPHGYFQEVVSIAGPVPSYSQVAQVPSAPFQEAENCAGPQPYYLQVAYLPPALMLVTPPRRFGTDYYLPRYPLDYHCFNSSNQTSLESSDESAVREEGTTVDEGPASAACADEIFVSITKAVAAPQEMHSETKVKAAQEEKLVNQTEALTSPQGESLQGEKTLNEAKVVAASEEGIQEAEAVAESEEQTIVPKAKVPSTNKDRKRQRGRKEPAALREAATAGVSVKAGGIRAPKEQKDIYEVKVVPTLKEDNRIISKVEEVVVPQVQVNVSLAKVPIGQKKCLPVRRERMTEAPTSVVYGKPTAVIEEIAVFEEAVVGLEEDKVVNEVEAVAAAEEEDKEFVNQTKAVTRLKKGKSRPRQRERKRKAAQKESVRAAAGEKEAKGNEISHMKQVWNSLKEVPLFIKSTFDKILFQVASLTARITGYSRTLKKILKLRAKLERKVVS